MKKTAPHIITIALSLLIACLFTSCKGKTDNNNPIEIDRKDIGYVAVQEKLFFNGDFEGDANQSKCRLHLSNNGGVISGTLIDDNGSVQLNGKISNEKAIGALNFLLGDIPFEAWYSGHRLIIKLDKETMDAIKLLLAASTNDATVLLADDRIEFDETR